MILFVPQLTFAEVIDKNLFKDRDLKGDESYHISGLEDPIDLNKIHNRQIILKLSKTDEFNPSAYKIDLAEGKGLEQENVLIIHVPKEIDFEEKLDELRQSDAVLFAEPDYIVDSSFTPSETLLHNQWYLKQVNMPAAWEIHEGSADTTIAVLDTGVNAQHPALKSRVLPGYDFVNNDKNPLDDHGHGTHVAGIAAANTTEKMTGLDLHADILPVKVMDHHGDGKVSDIIKGIYYAIEHDADVINMSYVNYAYSKIEEEALWDAHEQGIVVVAASGNDGWQKPAYPASYPPVISIAATDQADQRASFSNFGDWIDLSAPGVDIYSSYYNGGFKHASGTSFAAPIVSSLAGMLKAQNPDWTPAQIEWALESTAFSSDPEEWNRQTGFGRIDAYEAFTTDLTEKASQQKPALQSIELQANHSFDDQLALPLSSNWYVFTLDKKAEITIELQNIPKHLDLIGTLFRYDNDKLDEIETFNKGDKGQDEHLTIHLDAGTYYLAVHDYYGNWSKDVYQLYIAETASPTFSDVKRNHRYHKQIQYLAGRGIIKGYDNGTFQPYKEITRLQAVQMILNDMGIDPNEYTAPNPKLKDIQPGSYGYDAIAAAVDLGFIKGKDNGTFDKYDNLTRVQMAAIMVNAYNLKGTSTASFKDVPQGHWAYSVVNTLAANGITKGFEDQTFRPYEDISRAQFSVFLYQHLN